MESAQQQTPTVQQAPQQEAPAPSSAGPGNRERAEAAGLGGGAGDPGVVIANLPALRADPEGASLRLLLTLPAGGGFLGRRARFEAGVAAWEQQDAAGIERAWAAEDPELAAVLGDVPSEEESAALRAGVRATLGRLCVDRMMRDSGALGVLKGTVTEGGEPAWAALEADYPGCRAELEGAIPAAGAGLPAAAAGQATGAAGNLPKTKEEALQRHEAGRQKVAKLIQTALAIEPGSDPYSRPNQLRNSAQWVVQGEATMRVLSPTHDSGARGGGIKIANFDSRKTWDQAGATYEEGNTAGITWINAGVAGTSNGTEIQLFDPIRFGDSELTDTLIHEVQHDANQYNGRWKQEIVYGGNGSDEINTSFNLYLSELSAYWFASGEDSPEDTLSLSSEPALNNQPVVIWQIDAGGSEVANAVSTNFQNARQEAIFWHMATSSNEDLFSDPPDLSKTYSYLPYFYVTSPPFKQAVDRAAAPTSGNPGNSVRIEHLSDAIASGSVDQFMDAWAELEPADRVAACASGALKRQVGESNLSIVDQATILQVLQQRPAAGTAPAQLTVQAGDTLEKIALRIFGTPERWREIYALNRDQLDSPDAIRAGMLLKLPAH